MAPEPYVLDTTVIINLACVDKPVRNRVVEALAEMAVVAMEVDEEDDIPMIERGDQLREVISKPFDPPDEHLGEAASAALAERLGGTLVTMRTSSLPVVGSTPAQPSADADVSRRAGASVLAPGVSAASRSSVWDGGGMDLPEPYDALADTDALLVNTSPGSVLARLSTAEIRSSLPSGRTWCLLAVCDASS